MRGPLHGVISLFKEYGDGLGLADFLFVCFLIILKEFLSPMKELGNWAWWQPSSKTSTQEVEAVDHELEDTLNYMVRSCLKRAKG